MPRPRKEPTSPRSQLLSCRLTPTEHARLAKAARQANLTLSDFVRALLINRKITVTHHVRTFDADLYDELRRIGVNLNQAVHRFHSTGWAPPELARAAAAVEKAVMKLIAE
jgi:uncharacterized protein (DUF1778 family)